MARLVVCTISAVWYKTHTLRVAIMGTTENQCTHTHTYSCTRDTLCICAKRVMPSKYTLYKWLCDHCAHLCDTEPECVVHERETHRQLLDGDDQLHTALEHMCTRVAHIDDMHTVNTYERLCRTLLAKCIEVKTAHVSMAAPAAASEMRTHTRPQQIRSPMLSPPPIHWSIADGRQINSVVNEYYMRGNSEQKQCRRSQNASAVSADDVIAHIDEYGSRQDLSIDDDIHEVNNGVDSPEHSVDDTTEIRHMDNNKAKLMLPSAADTAGTFYMPQLGLARTPPRYRR